MDQGEPVLFWDEVIIFGTLFVFGIILPAFAVYGIYCAYVRFFQ